MLKGSRIANGMSKMSEVSENWLQRVRLTAAEPVVWLNCARMLRQAAEDLWDAGNAHSASPGSELGAIVLASYQTPGFTPPPTGGITRNVCFMLFGYALENLTKGVILCRDPSLVKSRFLEKLGQHGHELVYLFERAGIELTDEEREVLERTTRMTMWKGRYPVPLKFATSRGDDPMLGYIAVGNWPEEDYSALSDLYDKAKLALQQTMQSVPPLPEDHNFASPT